MKPLKNTPDSFGLVAITLHWLLALLVILMLVLGFTIGALHGSEMKALRGLLIFIHKEIGVSVLLLVTFRLIWRFLNVVPSLEPHIPSWQKFVARVTHVALYGFMFALPISGWAMSSAAGFPVSFFGLFNLPLLLSPDEHTAHLLLGIHVWLAFGLIATLVLHVGGALMHHFIDKDDTLRKMLP